MNGIFHLIWKGGGVLYVSIALIFSNFAVESSVINRRLHFMLRIPSLENLPNNFRKYNNSKSELLDFREGRQAILVPIVSEISKGPKANITITNNQSEFKINENLLLKASETYRSKLGLEDFMLDVFIEDEKSIKKINFEKFGKDRPTDIISLRDDLIYTKTNYHLNRTPAKVPEHYHLGEIFLCPGYIQRTSELEFSSENSSETNISEEKNKGGVAVRIQGVAELDRRMCYLLSHGILHLIGCVAIEDKITKKFRYDHVSDDDLVEMTKMEDLLLDSLIEQRLQ